MAEKNQVKLIHDYVSFMGKLYIILLSSLDKFSAAPLSTNEKLVLQILDEEAISITEISVRTGLALSTLTNVIDKMEGKRLVWRRHSSTDRRKVEIELGVEGNKIKSKFNNLIRQLATTCIEILPDEDGRNFTDALEKTVHTLSEEAEKIQDTFGSLIEPLKVILNTQLKGNQKT